MNETDAPLSTNSEEAEAIFSCHFRLVLDGDKSLDIDALGNGLLNASYPAIGQALATYLADDVKNAQSKC